MVEWTDEAVQAAISAFMGEYEAPGMEQDMRAALDAAVKAQGLVDRAAAERFTKAHGDLCRQECRAEALEEAAKVCEQGVNNATDWDSSYWDQACENRAAAIRALKEPSKG